MYIRTIAASAALALTGFSASAQGTSEEAFRIAVAQNACSGEDFIESAEFEDATTIRVVCRVPAAADFGGGLGAAAAGALLVTALLSIDGDGSSSTTTTN